jgi:hypothetical protein
VHHPRVVAFDVADGRERLVGPSVGEQRPGEPCTRRAAAAELDRLLRVGDRCGVVAEVLAQPRALDERLGARL